MVHEHESKTEADLGAKIDDAALPGGIVRALRDGSAYAWRPDPDYPGVVQLIVRAPDGVAAVRLVRGQLRVFLADGASVGGLRQTSPAIERSAVAAMLAGAMRRNLELTRELWVRDPVAAEALIKALLDDIKSWQPSLTSGTLEL